MEGLSCPLAQPRRSRNPARCQTIGNPSRADLGTQSTSSSHRVAEPCASPMDPLRVCLVSNGTNISSAVSLVATLVCS
jgi:hypothetical protein